MVAGSAWPGRRVEWRWYRGGRAGRFHPESVSPMALAHTPGGEPWVLASAGGSVGLYVRRQDQWQAAPTPHALPASARTFAWFREQLWLGGPFLLRLTERGWREVEGAPEGGGRLVTGRDGALWLANERALWWTADGEGWEPVPAQGDGGHWTEGLPTALQVDAEGCVWVAASGPHPRGGPLHRWSPRERSWHVVPAPPSRRFALVNGLVVEGSGAIWVGTHDGVWFREAAAWSRFQVPRRGGRGAGLPTPWVAGLAQDRRGRIWAATLGGIGVYTAGNWRTAVIGPVRRDGVLIQEPWAPSGVCGFALDEADRLWFATPTQVGWLDTASDDHDTADFVAPPGW